MIIYTITNHPQVFFPPLYIQNTNYHQMFNPFQPGSFFKQPRLMAAMENGDLERAVNEATEEAKGGVKPRPAAEAAAE